MTKIAFIGSATATAKLAPYDEAVIYLRNHTVADGPVRLARVIPMEAT